MGGSDWGTTACGPCEWRALYRTIEDWLFTSLLGGASGNATTAAGCTGACVFNYNVTAGATHWEILPQGWQETGGTSGIVIDNDSLTQGGVRIFTSAR